LVSVAVLQTTRRQFPEDINADIQISQKETSNLRKKFAHGNTDKANKYV
jgi:hypothetical protein